MITQGKTLDEKYSASYERLVELLINKNYPETSAEFWIKWKGGIIEIPAVVFNTFTENHPDFDFESSGYRVEFDVGYNFYESIFLYPVSKMEV